MKKVIMFFLIVCMLFSVGGCAMNSSPTVITPDVYRQEKNQETKEIVVSKVENSEFVFVKKGDIYYLKKANEVNEDK